MPVDPRNFLFIGYRNFSVHGEVKRRDSYTLMAFQERHAGYCALNKAFQVTRGQVLLLDNHVKINKNTQNSSLC